MRLVHKYPAAGGQVPKVSIDGNAIYVLEQRTTDAKSIVLCRIIIG